MKARGLAPAPSLYTTVRTDVYGRRKAHLGRSEGQGRNSASADTSGRGFGLFPPAPHDGNGDLCAIGLIVGTLQCKYGQIAERISNSEVDRRPSLVRSSTCDGRIPFSSVLPRPDWTHTRSACSSSSLLSMAYDTGTP